MKNIVLLGSNGKIGKSFLINKKHIYNIHSDSDHTIDGLLKKSFLIKNDIDLIVNCIGSTKNSSLFFHSNFFVPLCIARSLKELSLISHKKIIFIHLSSIGVNDPYGRLSTSKINLKIDQRIPLYFNKYELSKCCADYFIRYYLDKNENVTTYILQPSVIIDKQSQFLKKVFFFLLLFPLKVSSKAAPPITSLENLNFHFDKIIENKTYKLPKREDFIYTIQVFERIPIIELFPSYKYISFLKIPIKKRNLFRLMKFLPAIFPLTSFKRILVFLTLI